MCGFAENDSRICCVTAAMAEGTGLCEFSKKFPKRFFDVGIAEQHAVTFSSGLAKNGMVPVFAVYSTFLQRSYDQLIHDVSMQKLKVVFAVDRAGFVGEDGESHQGIYDTAFLNSVIGLTVFAPSYYAELEAMFYEGIYKVNGAVAVRYPRGNERYKPENYEYKHEPYYILGSTNAENCIVTYGRLFSECAKAYESLENTFVIKLNRIKPIDENIFDSLWESKKIFFFEEGIKSGGVGEVFASMLAEKGITAHFKHIAVNDEFVKQASVDRQLSRYKLDCDSVIEEVKNA